MEKKESRVNIYCGQTQCLRSLIFNKNARMHTHTRESMGSPKHSELCHEGRGVESVATHLLSYLNQLHHTSTYSTLAPYLSISTSLTIYKGLHVIELELLVKFVSEDPH